MNESSKKDLIERYLAAYNAFDVDSMLALLSQDIRFENYCGNVLTAEATGRDEFRRLAERASTLFSEREQRIAALQFNHDAAIATIDYHGTLAMDIPEGPVAGTVIDLQGSSEFSFDHDRIVRIVDRS